VTTTEIESARKGVGGAGARQLAAAQRRLHGAASIGELLRQGCQAAAEWCGFSRALILAVEDDRLTAAQLGALPDPASDALRRRALADPIMLRPGSAESELIRGAEGGRGSGGQPASVLQEALDLEQLALGVVIPEENVLALLVLDRPAPAVEQAEHDAVALFACLIGSALERQFLRTRMQELSLELRHLTASAQAAMREALESPVALPVDYGTGPVFPSTYPVTQHVDQLRELLTPRELQIAARLVAGRSNREIAADLHLSPETVKGYVAKVLRKLGASNRVDAVSRYLRLSGSTDTT